MKKTIQFKNFCLILSLYFSSVINLPFWKEFFSLSGGVHFSDSYSYVSVFLIFTVGFFVIFHTLLFKYLTKIVSLLLIFTSAIASYALSRFKVHFSSIIVRSLFESDQLELRAFISSDLLIDLFFFVLLPSVLVVLIRIEYPSLVRLMINKIRVLVFAPFLIALIYLSNQLLLNTLVDKAEARHLKAMIIPFNVAKGVREYLNERPKSLSLGFGLQPPATPAAYPGSQTYPPIVNSKGRKVLFVFVLGESARASSFSLNGYHRETNPKLRKIRNLLSYSQFYACGTATAISVPCMFSSLGREGFDHKKVDEQENLLQTARRNGIDVKWFDNGMGGQRVVKDGIQEISLGNYYEADLDSVLTQHLPTRDELIRENHHRFIVLHQRGSHGPDYWKRYSREFAIFTPDCSSGSLSRSCTRDEIVNAYDNTIIYTDKNLSDTIAKLEQLSDIYDTALLYVSDHGESTGEFGVYMHGLPYSIAPEDQIRIPFIVWFSDSFIKRRGLDLNCLDKNKANKYSHDNIYSSVLSLFDVGSISSQYQSKTDLFDSCITRSAK